MILPVISSFGSFMVVSNFGSSYSIDAGYNFKLWPDPSFVLTVADQKIL